MTDQGRGQSRNPDCRDQAGNPTWSCIEFDGTGLWCDSCLAWAERVASADASETYWCGKCKQRVASDHASRQTPDTPTSTST